MKPLRHVVVAALLLMLVITTTSAFIRFSQSGLSCADWPACYGRPAAESGAVAAEDSSVFVARAVHRIAASAAGILLLAVVVLGWNRRLRTSRRAAGIALLALAGFLAWLGNYTPSALPAVTLGNLLAGMAMVALLAWLAQAEASSTASPRLRLWTGIALAAAMLQIALGGLIGARAAALACPGLPGCGGALWPAGAGWEAFDPFRAADPGEASRQALHLAHRVGALLTGALLLWVGGCHARLHGAQKALGWTLIALVALQLALGAALPISGFPLALAVAHNAVAALVLVTVASMRVRLRRETVPA